MFFAIILLILFQIPLSIHLFFIDYYKNCMYNNSIHYLGDNHV